MSLLSSLDYEDVKYLGMYLHADNTTLDMMNAFKLGMHYIELKKSKKAIRFFMKTIEFYRKLDNKTMEQFDSKTTLDLHKMYIYALLNLGVLYDVHPETVDYIKAKYYYEQASQYNDPDALNNLANMYAQGKGGDVDRKKALELFQKAALLNHVFAQNSIGRIYEFGIGVEKDLEKAEYWYKKASESGDKIATENLYRIRSKNQNESMNSYLSDTGNITKIYGEYENVPMRFPCGDCKYGMRHYNNEGHYATYCYYRQEHINPQIAMLCSDFIEYESGKTIEECKTTKKICKDCKYSELHMTSSGHVFYYCSKVKQCMYLFKIACPAFRDKSDLGCENGNEEFNIDTNIEHIKKQKAKELKSKELYNIALEYECENKNYNLALKNMQKAAQLDCIEAQYKMFFYFTENIITECNYKKAEFWLKKAANAGFEPAIKKLKDLK